MAGATELFLVVLMAMQNTCRHVASIKNHRVVNPISTTVDSLAFFVMRIVTRAGQSSVLQSNTPFT